MQFENSDQLNKYVADMAGGTTILAFSNGKDSICAWLVLRRYFKRIIPYYMYPIPDIEFIEKGLKYYEEFFETPILRYPHSSLYRMINNLMFQAPERCHVIEQFGLPEFEYDELNDIVREEMGLGENVYCATGVRARDSLVRWTAVKKYGPLNATKRTFFPVFDYTKAMLMNELHEAKIKLPVDYRMFGRSWDGMDFRFTKEIKDHYPKDYEKILSWFPLIELDLKRMEYRQEYYDEINKKGVKENEQSKKGNKGKKAGNNRSR